MTESALHHQPNGAVADLRSLLLRFATPAEVLAHQVSENGQNPKSRLKLFLQTIDETVLPRLCTVSLNGAPLAELTLVDRRLGSVRMHVDTPNTTKKETA